MVRRTRPQSFPTQSSSVQCVMASLFYVFNCEIAFHIDDEEGETDSDDLFVSLFFSRVVPCVCHTHPRRGNDCELFPL